MRRKNEAAGGVVLFLFGAITVGLSLQMPIGNLRAAGPGMFPLALGILLMTLSGVSVLRLLAQDNAASSLAPSGVPARQVALFTGSVGLAALLLDPLGYPLTSFLLLVALLRILGAKRWKGSLSLSFLLAGISYLVFVFWLKVPLPRGFMGL